MTHLRPEELSATLDGALHGEARESAERHLAECAICRDSLASLADQDTKLRLVLEHDPGEAYFSNFAARVEDRIRAAGLQGAQARLDREGTWGWLLSPRRLAWAGALAAVVGGAGIVMLTSRPPQHALLETPQIVEQSRPPSEDLASGARQEQAPAERVPADQKEGATRDARRADTGPARLQESNAMRDEQRAETSAEELARGTSEGAASPQRAKAVQRSASGEDVPVSGQATPFAAPPPKSEASGGLAGVKPRAAPMEQQPSSSLALTEKKDRDASTTLCGRVLDAGQRPVAGATVVLADRGLVTKTAADGRFCLQASAGLHELSVMAVGFEPTRLQVRVEGESSEALVTLRPVSVLDKPLAKSTSPSPAGGTLLGGASPSISSSSARPEPSGGTSYGYLEQPSSAKANTTLERARTASRTAESAGTAAAFDAAAAAWAKVVPIAMPGAPRNDALYSVAEARFRAWQLGSTSSRAKSARTAFDAFLKAELAGARKDQVTAWRAQLPR